MDTFKWSCSSLNREPFANCNNLKKTKVDRHPLEANVITVSSSNITGKQTSVTTTSWGGFDPLSDPLSNLKIDESISPVEEDVILRWPTFRSKVLSKYKVDNKISIKSSFLSIAKSTNSSTVTASTSTSSVADQVKQRLQTIDEASSSDNSKETINLTPEEFSIKMKQMDQLLLESWNSDQRVKSLKIVIQVTKILSEIPNLNFYPSQFMLITNILDSFGSLVSLRITNKINELTTNSNAQDVAIETAKNWFYKVSSIRELIPRFFIEISILKIYKFVFSSNQIIANLHRLSISVNGISHPVVSIYARCYLIKTITELSSCDPTCYPNHSIHKIILINFKSISSLAHQLEDVSLIDLKNDYSVLSPALDWLINCEKSLEGEQTELLFNELSSFNESKCLSGIILKSILDHCSNSFIRSNHYPLLDCIVNFQSSDYPVSELIVSFGTRVNSSNCFSDAEAAVKRKVISKIWKKMSTLPLDQYLNCASAWIEFIVVNLNRSESEVVLNELVKRVNSNSNRENGPENSKSIDLALLNIIKSVAKLTSSIHLITRSIVPLLISISKSEIKIEACKFLIEGVIGDDDEQNGSTSKRLENDVIEEESSDQETNKSLYSLCKILSDSIDFMTIEDEKREISRLIISCLRVIMFAKDQGIVSDDGLESRLDLLMESRSDFCDLDQVTIFLVYSSNSLAVQCLNQGKKFLNRKSLVQSCLAYSYITIPSLFDHHIQLQLYLNSIQVSLMTASLSQTDSFLKSAITLLNTLPASYDTFDGRSMTFDTFFFDYCSNLLSLLILVPDHPDHEIIYLTKALFNVASSRQIADSSLKVSLLLKFLCYVSWCLQENYPFSINGIDSNDRLYGGDEVFVSELETFGTKILNEILEKISYIKNEKEKKRCTKDILEFINVYGDKKEMATLCNKLLKICK